MGMKQSGGGLSPQAIALARQLQTPLDHGDDGGVRKPLMPVFTPGYRDGDGDWRTNGPAVDTGPQAMPRPQGMVGRAADAYLAASSGNRNGSLASQEADNAQAAMQAAMQGRMPSYSAPHGGMDLQTLLQILKGSQTR